MPFYQYLFGSGWLFIFIANDIKEDLAAFNTDVTIFENVTKNRDEHRFKLTNKFCAIIQLYTDAKE